MTVGGGRRGFLRPWRRRMSSGRSWALELSKPRPHTGYLTICAGLSNAFIPLDSVVKGYAWSHHVPGWDELNKLTCTFK